MSRRESSPEAAREAASVSRRAEPGILRQVQQRTRRRSARVKPPAWALWLARHVPRLAMFFRQTLPEYLKAHQAELKTGAASFGIHLLLVLLLAWWVVPTGTQEEFFALIASTETDAELEEATELPQIVQPEQILDLQVDSTARQLLSELNKGLQSRQIDDVLDQDLQVPLDVLARNLEIPMQAGDLGGRTAAGRRAGVQKYGGSADSERAVNAGLKWLQSIQQPDGSWSFGKVGEAGSPGSLDTTDMGATALALLCYLGAGHTHQTEGPYQTVVARGLAWMMQQADRNSSGADLRGKSQANAGMYVQGIATICLCEASAMAPEDRELRRLAIAAIAFIERAQDPVGGGWRYVPRQPGDTSVVGWQVMALHSARVGRIRVAGSTLRDAREFLNSVQADDGASYGYMEPQANRPAMTAVGLLCRMYLGWKLEHPALQRGVHRLAAIGPSSTDLYYNYYATQVLRHFGGELWEQWNLKMRQQLVETQVRTGPGAGSWDVTDPHGSGGGRIYQTALSILTLEVYYRYLPIYRRLDSAQTADTSVQD